MARTRRQRRWADASAGSQLRFIMIGLAFVLILVDIILGGVLPLWLVFTAAFYAFFEGCLKALPAIRGRASR